MYYITSLSARDPRGPKKASAEDSACLHRYVVATCYPKMSYRLNHETLSLPLIEALQQIQTFKFDESKLEGQEEGTKSDIQFLTDFLANVSLITPIPKIKKITVPKDHRAFRLYTQDTCAEFHALLIKVLLRFSSSLKKLRKYPKDLGAPTPTPSSQYIKDEVECAFIYGYALHRLTKGAALSMHLKSIAPLLMGFNLGEKIRMPTPAPGEQQEEPDEELEVVQQEEPDEELKAVQPFVHVDGIETPLWQSYLDWLRLMVAHFDATDIPLTYVTGQSFVHHYFYPGISRPTCGPPFTPIA